MKDGVESLGRVRATGIALLIVMFVVGAMAGIAFERVRLDQTERLAPERGPGGMPDMRPGMLPPMFGQLGLSDTQRERIRQIMEDSRPRTEEVLDELMPRLRAVTDSVRKEIRQVLTPEQATLLDSLMIEMRPRGGPWGGRRRGPGRRPGPR